MDELQNNQELILITSEIAKIENQLQDYKKLQNRYDEFRKKLFDAMTENDVAKFESPEGIKFTIVSGSPEKTELVLWFNEKAFQEENPEVYKSFLEQKEKVTKARKSYLKITLPKEKKEEE